MDKGVFFALGRGARFNKTRFAQDINMFKDEDEIMPKPSASQALDFFGTSTKKHGSSSSSTTSKKKISIKNEDDEDESGVVESAYKKRRRQNDNGGSDDDGGSEGVAETTTDVDDVSPSTSYKRKS
eukprot:TRINITY_DN3155_c4_g2_i1.p2 TRINITY_DN3155_c4_g2~~TRINITY_DN3155_c4_g2_i1.p2  ORF type:complete len:126 (+),score=49.62 TRINITY_DN3155_c4_g2_i1:38-415(+)